jgi:hypothetical protein
MTSTGDTTDRDRPLLPPAVSDETGRVDGDVIGLGFSFPLFFGASVDLMRRTFS